LLTNNAFEKIFNYIPTDKAELQEINSYQILTKLLEQLNSAGIFYTEEIEINNTSYTVSLSKIIGTDEIIFVFHNVSELKKLEKIKKDFIVNVSHELKTPLTAIKGFIETLEEEITDSEHLRYIQIVRRHTDRLIDIVQDLLLLSELEDKSAVDKLLITSVDFQF